MISVTAEVSAQLKNMRGHQAQAGGHPESGGGGRRRNILFITADQFRADCLGAAGHPIIQTPNLDSLAANGTLFTHNFANCVPCAPSRASIHTGIYQRTHRIVINGNPLDARFTTWAKELRAAGRDPVLFGYTDTALDPRTLPPGDPGLTTYESVLPGLRRLADCNDEHETMEDWANWLTAKGYDVPEHRARLRRDTVPTTPAGAEAEGGDCPASKEAPPEPLQLPAELSDTAFLVGEARDYIQGCGDQEWTVHLSLFRPHTPHVAPAPYNAMYWPDVLSLPALARAPTAENEAQVHPFLSWALQWYPCAEDEIAQRKLEASYYGLISEVDEHLGRLFDFLKASGQWDDTLIVFTSDHGEQMGDHHLRSKTGFFDQSYRTPLIVRDPRAEADAHRGTVLHGFTEAVDLFPTLLDYAGVRAPSQCDGLSLLPAVHAGAMPASWRQEAFFEYTFWYETLGGRNAQNAQPQLACLPPARSLGGALTLAEHFCPRPRPHLRSHGGAPLRLFSAPPPPCLLPGPTST